MGSLGWCSQGGVETFASAGWVEGVWATDEGVVKVRMLRHSRSGQSDWYFFIFSSFELVFCWLVGYCGSACVFMWYVCGVVCEMCVGSMMQVCSVLRICVCVRVCVCGVEMSMYGVHVV